MEALLDILETCVGSSRPLEDMQASSFYFSLIKAIIALVPEVGLSPE